MTKSFASSASAAAMLTLLFGPLSADQLSDIKAAGTINFGVKADSKPWAYVDTSGNPVGFEIDLAEAVAEKLGVEPTFTTVSSANRIQFLEQGNIDVVLATMSDTEKRRQVVTMVEPHYFADATNVLFTDSAFTDWDSVENASLCGVRGSFYNRWVAEEYSADVQAYAGVPEAIAALKQGQCGGFIYADQILRMQIAEDAALADYVVGLEPVNPDYWAMAVELGEDGAALNSELSEIVADLHASGAILRFAQEHGLGDNPFLKEQAAD